MSDEEFMEKFLIVIQEKITDLELKLKKVYDNATDYKTFDDYKEAIEKYESDLFLWGSKLRLHKKYNLSKIPKDVDLMNLSDFIELCKNESLTNDDGSGFYATSDNISDIEIYPMDVHAQMIRSDFDKVVWYNK